MLCAMPSALESGDKKPLGFVPPFVCGSGLFAGLIGFDFRFLCLVDPGGPVGLPERVRERLDLDAGSLLLSPDTSTRRCRRAAERVVGAEYPSLDSELLSEGAGEGEMTLGVSGTAFWEDMSAGRKANDGRTGDRINPDKGRRVREG